MKRTLVECDNRYQGQEELRLRALEQMKIRPGTSSPLSISPSPDTLSHSSAISHSASKAQSTPNISPRRDRYFVEDQETQTDEWRSLICQNCSASFNEDDDNILCTDCSFWRHYKCINRQVYDGDECDGADQCTFCYAMEKKLPRQDLMMNDKFQMIDTQSPEDPEPDLPKGDSWKFYWNITRLSDGRNFKAGEYVYIPDTEKNVVVIWFIDYLFYDSENTPFAYVSELCFPENIMRFPAEKFFPNEVYQMTAIGAKDGSQMSYARLDSLRGPSLVVLSLSDFRQHIPRGIPPAHVYLERKIYIRSGRLQSHKTVWLSKKSDYSTCTKDWALKLRSRPLSADLHPEKKFNDINWPSFRIKPSDLTFT